MATGHWFTNRGKTRLLKNAWNDTGGTTIKMGLLVGASAPAAIDTAAEVADVDTVAGLLALSGVAEATGGWYSRKTLSRTVPSEDDTNDRVNMDASDVTWTAAASGQTVYATFTFIDAGGADSGNDLLSVDVFATPLPLNGADFTYAIADLYRAS